MRRIIFDGYDVFSGYMLERYFREVLKEREKFSRIGSWWDRKGENEIDIVAIDEFEKVIAFYEVKRNPAKISLPVLEDKIENFMHVNPEIAKYTKKVEGLSIQDMTTPELKPWKNSHKLSNQEDEGKCSLQRAFYNRFDFYIEQICKMLSI